MMFTKEEILTYSDMYPNMVAMTLYQRTYGTAASGGDTFDAGTSQARCRKVEANHEQVAMLGGSMDEDWTEIHVWNDGQVKTPRELDVLQESGGTRWTVRKLQDALLEALFVCTCQRER